MNTIFSAITFPAQVRTRVDVFEEIFLVFLGLGTLVGIVVIAYMLYNAYKYRDTEDQPDDENLPSVGELPTGGKGGKKLFLSFGLSAIIVISLVIWTYGMLLYVEDGPDQGPEDAMEIEVEGFAFGWDFAYENGLEPDTLTVPADQAIWIETTSRDVWHTFGISDLRVKADAIPGEVDETWFMADSTGEYTAQCYELCGVSHSEMVADVEVLSQEEYEQWVDDQLTLEITLEDGSAPEDEDEAFVTEGFEVALEHQNNSEYEEDLSFTYTADSEEFESENGTLNITDIEQGGPYNVTITPQDDAQFEEVEDEIDFTGPTSETFTLESPEADGDGGEDGDDGGDAENGGDDGTDEGGNGTETEDESNGETDNETIDNETTDGGDGE